MSEWNFDMSQAPRGRLVTKTLTSKKGTSTWEQHEPESIIATDGEMVTISRWLPPITKGPSSHQRPGRWNMFGVHEVPVAWMPMPKPPGRREKE